MNAELALTSIGVLASCLCILLAVFLLVANGPLKPANRALAGFLFLTAVDVSGWAAGMLPADWREAFLFRLPLAFLQMPVLFCYAVALCFPLRRTRLHLLGGFVAVLASAGTLLPRALAAHSPTSGLDLIANEIGLHLQFYIYIALMVHVLVQYRWAYPQFHSDPGARTFTWLAVLTGVSFLAHSLVLVKSLARIWHQAMATALEAWVGLIAVGITGALTLAALLRQDLFLGVVVEPAAETLPPPSDPAPEDREAIVRVRTYMEESQPFLEASLTVRSLARRLGMGQRELSVLINQQMGVHFFDFVNRYRVEKAALMLVDSVHRDLSVLHVAFQVGFNSKSSFNAAFRRHMGMTPTAFRRSASFDGDREA